MIEMWQFILGMILGGAFGFFVAALFVGVGAHKQEQAQEEREQSRSN